MANHPIARGVWLTRNVIWIALVAALGFGGLMLALDWPLALAFVPALVVALGAWFGGKGLIGAGGADIVAPVAMQDPPLPDAPLTPRDTGEHWPAALVEAFPLPLVLIDAGEVVEAASLTARQMFPALKLGRPVSLALRNPDLLDALVAVRRDAGKRTIILDDTASGGPVMRVYVVGLAGPAVSEASVICVFEDLTEQRATERMRVDFIANASHELRTPLASLLGFIETLQGPARDDTAARERFLIIMREQAARMARLIDDLLSLSRAELRAHQRPQDLIDPGGIVREIVASLGLSAKERGVGLAVDLPGEPLPIRGDRDDLLRIVENLVENAIRYGRDGGPVEISLRASPDGERIVAVRDHGPGIAPEHLPRLTERFYRVDASHSRENGGTGLGLAIVKHLVARHAARLEIESRLGEGATFRVVFPRPDT